MSDDEIQDEAEQTTDEDVEAPEAEVEVQVVADEDVEAPEAEVEVQVVADDDDVDDDDDFDDLDEDWDDEEALHVARQKPELDDETKAALTMRAEQARRQPTFRRQEWFRYQRLARTTWRRPKGLQSKQRLNKKYRSPMVRIGHRKVAAARGLHPSGFREVMVHNPTDLESIEPATEAARVGGTVGGRKREQIYARADDLGIRVLNRRRG